MSPSRDQPSSSARPNAVQTICDATVEAPQRIHSSNQRGLAWRFIQFSFGYWGSTSLRTAWMLSLGFLSGLVATLVVSVSINSWSKEFFDALQLREMGALIRSIEKLMLLAAAAAVAAIATIQCRMRLQVSWRLWLMSNLVSRWLQKGADREFVATSIDNPEARIAEDGRAAIELFVDLAGGIINTFLFSASFTVVLWQVGGTFMLFGAEVHGYLVFAAILYAGLTSLFMLVLGYPLVLSVEEKAMAEGNLRYALTQARSNTETTAATKVNRRESEDLQGYMYRLAKKWMLVLRHQTTMIGFSSANNVLAPIVPLLLCSPKFIAGEMTLGDLMQAAAAFLHVQASLNWLADNALFLANWSASARRIAALDLAIEAQEDRRPN